MKLVSLAGKELQDVLREKSLIVAFLVQLFLAGFSTLLLTGLTALYSPEAIDAAPDADIAYIGSGGFDAYLEGEPNLRVFDATLDEALADFREGGFRAIVQESGLTNESLRRITILLPDGELEATLLVTQMKSLLIEYERDLRVDRQDRLETELVFLEPDVHPEEPYGFVYGTLIPLLIVTPIFLSGAIAGDALAQESRTRTLLVLRSAPVSPGMLVAGKLLVPVLLVPFQVLLWMALFALNGFPTADPVMVLVTATLFGLFLCSLGMATATLVKNEAATQAVYALVVILIALLSLLLPRDPLNVFALLSTGSWAPGLGLTIGLVGGAAVASTVGAALWTRFAIARDRM